MTIRHIGMWLQAMPQPSPDARKELEMATTVQHNLHQGTVSLLNRGLIGAGLLLLMLLVGVQVARSGVPSSLASAPSTTAYHFSSHPMIAGTVVTVNDREMVTSTTNLRCRPNRWHWIYEKGRTS